MVYSSIKTNEFMKHETMYKYFIMHNEHIPFMYTVIICAASVNEFLFPIYISVIYIHLSSIFFIT